MYSTVQCGVQEQGSVTVQCRIQEKGLVCILLCSVLVCILYFVVQCIGAGFGHCVVQNIGEGFDMYSTVQCSVQEKGLVCILLCSVLVCILLCSVLVCILLCSVVYRKRVWSVIYCVVQCIGGEGFGLYSTVQCSVQEKGLVSILVFFIFCS